LFSLSKEYLETFKIDFIIANTQENRYDKVYLISSEEKFEIFKDEISTLDEKLINMVISMHNLHIQKCNYNLLDLIILNCINLIVKIIKPQNNENFDLQ